MNLPENIRYYRERAGMYQSALGRALGVSAQAVSKWELGKAEPDSACIQKMCELFNISADALLGIENAKEETEDIMKIRQLIRTDPSYRTLFDTASRSNPEHVRAAAEMLKALGPKDEFE